MTEPRKYIFAILITLTLIGGIAEKPIYSSEDGRVFLTRPTITPIARPALTPASAPVHRQSPVVGTAHIKLQLQKEMIPNDWWTIVQWKDANGSWHDVEGWQDHFDRNGQVRWWVDPKDSNTGPFRWVIYAGRNNLRVIWVSALFVLPRQGEMLEIKVSM